MTGFVVAFLVYQIGTLIAAGTFGTGFIPGLIAVIVIAAIAVGIIVRNENKFAAEYK